MIKTANTEHEFKDIVMADLKSHNILTQKAILKSTLIIGLAMLNVLIPVIQK